LYLHQVCYQLNQLNDLSVSKSAILKHLIAKYDSWYESVGAKPYFKEPMKWQSSITNVLKEGKNDEKE
jgi:hypothetical protein